jgi:hypothetical protein
MVHHASRLTRAAITTTIAVLGIAATTFATPASAGAQGHATHQQTCLIGGGYTRLKMSPAPMTVFGSLQASQSVTFSVQAQNGLTCVAGTVVYVNISSRVNGDVLAPQTPSECGGTTQISFNEVACTTDATGKVVLVYTAPSTIPDSGTVEVNAENASSHANVSGHDWYLYQMLYQFSASPIAHGGTLAAGQPVVDTLTASGVGGTPEQNDTVYLSFASTASPAGSANVGGTALTSFPTAFKTDTNGQIQITYTAPTTLPSSGVDTIKAGSSTSSTPNVFNATSYAFASTTPTVSVGDVAQVEGDGPGPNDPKGRGTYAEFDVTLSAPSSVPVTVSYITICGVGDKTCQEDYLQTVWPKTHSVTFNPGQTRAQINITIYSYSAIEAYPETYFVQLVNPSNAVLGRSVGNGTIIQDDETTSAQVLYVGDTSVVRGDSGTQFAEFTVTLALSPSAPVTFLYATANGTAISGTDYSPVSGTATIQPGSSSAHIQVPILPITSPGPTLTFTLTISNQSGAVIERSVGTGSVLNWN